MVGFAEQFLERLPRRNPAGRILLAVAAGEPDAGDKISRVVLKSNDNPNAPPPAKGRGSPAAKH